MKVLLVDDDDFLRDLYVNKFTEFGHTVAEAADAEQALNKLKDEDYDLVLLDMIMPGMTGLELLMEVTKQGLKKQAKFIVMSNQNAVSDEAAIKEAGADGYIIKAASIPSDVVKHAEALIIGK